MTTTTAHTFTAVVHAGGTDVPLEVIDADVTLDERQVPYVTAQITAAIPALVDLVDPRQQYRVTLTATRTDVSPAGAGQARTFDLTLHEADVDHNGGTLTVICRSDEAILLDAARVDTTPDNSQVSTGEQSLRSLLLTQIFLPRGWTGVLQGGAGDPTPRLSMIGGIEWNLATSPRANLTNWGVHSDLTGALVASVPQFFGRPGLRGARISGTGTAAVALRPQIGAPITGLNGRYKVRARVTAYIGARTDVIWRAQLASDNTVLEQTDPVRVGTAAARFLELDFEAPAGNTGIYFSTVWTGGAAGQGLIIGDLILAKLSDTEPVDLDQYWDGSTPVNDEWTHRWDGTTNDDESYRFPTYNELTWEPGVSAWDYISPLLQGAGVRLFCDEQRKWRLVDPTTFALPGAPVQLATAQNLLTAREGISRNSDWYDSVVIRWDSTNPNGTRNVEYETAGAPGTKTLSLQWDRKKPGTLLWGAATTAQSMLERVQGRAISTEIEALSDYTVTPGRAATATLPDGTVYQGFVESVTWRFSADSDTHGIMAVGFRAVGTGTNYVTNPDGSGATPALENNASAIVTAGTFSGVPAYRVESNSTTVSSARLRAVNRVPAAPGQRWQLRFTVRADAANSPLTGDLSGTPNGVRGRIRFYNAAPGATLGTITGDAVTRHHSVTAGNTATITLTGTAPAGTQSVGFVFEDDPAVVGDRFYLNELYLGRAL